MYWPEDERAGEVEKIFRILPPSTSARINWTTCFPPCTGACFLHSGSSGKAMEEPGSGIMFAPDRPEYGLNILHENLLIILIMRPDFVCGLTDSPPTGNDRTLLAVRFGVNRPGQLHEITGFFAENNIDLTFVQSRPYKVRPQEYVLIFEMIGHKSEPGLKNALNKVEQNVRATDGWKKVLGSYPHRKKEEKPLAHKPGRKSS